MATCDVWDIIKVPFPYTNRPVQQNRPALVVSRHGGTGLPTLLWVLMITSSSHRRWSGDVAVSDLTNTGLSAASMVRSAKIATIEEIAATRIGHLPEAGRAAIQEHLSKFMDEAIGPSSPGPAVPS